MYAFAPIKEKIDQGEMPSISDFPHPLKNENIESLYQGLLKTWDTILEESNTVYAVV